MLHKCAEAHPNATLPPLAFLLLHEVQSLLLQRFCAGTLEVTPHSRQQRERPRLVHRSGPRPPTAALDNVDRRGREQAARRESRAITTTLTKLFGPASEDATELSARRCGIAAALRSDWWPRAGPLG